MQKNIAQIDFEILGVYRRIAVDRQDRLSMHDFFHLERNSRASQPRITYGLTPLSTSDRDRQLFTETGKSHPHFRRAFRARKTKRKSTSSTHRIFRDAPTQESISDRVNCARIYSCYFRWQPRYPGYISDFSIWSDISPRAGERSSIEFGR